jgi:hypothetical protein
MVRPFADIYVRYLVDQELQLEGFTIGEGYPTPSGLELMLFIRWLVLSTRRTPTTGEVLLCAKNIVEGLYFMTGNRVSRGDTEELYTVSN